MSAAGNLWHGTLPRMAVYPISPRKDWVRIFASAPSASSANSPNGNGTNVFGDTTQRTVNGVADERADAGHNEAGSTVCATPLEPGRMDGADAADAKKPSQSGPEKNEG
jgi:hypothetical protein